MTPLLKLFKLGLRRGEFLFLCAYSKSLTHPAIHCDRGVCIVTWFKIKRWWLYLTSHRKNAIHYQTVLLINSDGCVTCLLDVSDLAVVENTTGLAWPRLPWNFFNCGPGYSNELMHCEGSFWHQQSWLIIILSIIIHFHFST